MIGRERCRVFCAAPLAESTQTTVIFSNALTEPRRRGLVLLGPHEQAGLRNPTAESSGSCQKPWERFGKEIKISKRRVRHTETTAKLFLYVLITRQARLVVQNSCRQTGDR